MAYKPSYTPHTYSRIDVIGQNGNGGEHYDDPPFNLDTTPEYYGKNDPFRYSLDNDLGVLEHTAIKYITRHRCKNGEEDIDKAINTLLRLKREVYGHQGQETKSEEW